MLRDLPPALLALTGPQNGLVTNAQAKAAGLCASDVWSQVRAGRWIPVLRGVYLLEPEVFEAGLPATTLWRAALLAHGRGFCLVAGTGARVFDLHGPALEETVIELGQIGTNPRATRRTRSLPFELEDGRRIVVRQFLVHPEEIVIVRGFPVRRADLTIVDAALDLSRARMLSILDSGLHLGLATAADLAVAIERAVGRPGIQQLRPLLHLADGRAESMVESHVRLACIDGDVPPDELQYEVRTTDGHLIAVGDLGWTKGRSRPLLAEADGESIHGQPQAIFRDRLRGNALAAAACDTVRFTFSDSLRPSYVASVIRAALDAA